MPRRIILAFVSIICVIAWLDGQSRLHAQHGLVQDAGIVRPQLPSRVRTDDHGLRELVREAMARSSTFERLLESIEATDGIVFLERGECGHGVGACLAHWMAHAGPNRVLRVVLNTRLQGDVAMASIAHELRHALEVLERRTIRTHADMFHFYRASRASREALETREAVAAGLAVARELRPSRRSASRLEPIHVEPTRPSPPPGDLPPPGQGLPGNSRPLPSAEATCPSD